MRTPAPLHYRIALASCAALTAYLFFHVPLLMTFDGADYIRLASLFGHNFLQSWDFGRTPLYPLLLRVCFWLLGKQPAAAVLPGVLYGFGGAWLLAATFRSMGFPRVATASLVVLSLSPVLIVYEHAILTEIGSFFYLALLVRLLVWRPANVLTQCGALAVALACASAHRPTAILLVPPTLLLVAGQLLLERKRAGGLRPWKASAKVVFPALALLLAGPVVETRTWKSVVHAAEAKGVRPRPYDGQQLLYGLTKQAVFPPDDPLLAPVRASYEKGIIESNDGARLDVGGLTRGAHWPVYTYVVNSGDQGARLFRETVVRNPGRYLKGVVRGLLLYLGVRSIDTENGYYLTRVFEGDQNAKLDLPAELLTPDMLSQFYRPVEDSVVTDWIYRLRFPYRVLFILGSVMTVLGFLVGLWNLRSDLLALTGLPLAWVVAHALTLMSSDRLTVPAQLVMLVNAVGVPAWLLRQYWGKTRTEAPTLDLSEPRST